METILMAVLVSLVAGATVSMQSPMASLMSQRLGLLSSVFIVHIGGAIVAFVPLVLSGGQQIREWRGVPWYALAAGALGLIVVGGVSYTIPRIGAAATATLMVVGQLLIAATVDHFGLLGTVARPVDLPRIAGFALLVAGAWLVTR